MIEFGITDAIDIIIVALLLYYIYELMRKSSSANIFSGIITFIFVLFFVSQIFEMRLLGTIMDKLLNMGALALIILFQEEIRSFFSSIGRQSKAYKLIKLFSNKKDYNDKRHHRDDIMPIVMACMNMAKRREGALIVIERNNDLSNIIKTGDLIEARINQRLIENIFFKNSPLHDGAMIISQDRIKAASCILPVSHNPNIPKSMGLRHRAALGISQKTDALTIVVSEETGYISVTSKGQFSIRLSPEELEHKLSTEWKK